MRPMCECTVVAQSLSFLHLTAQVLSSSNSATEHPLLLFSFLWLPVISLLPIYSFRMPQILINLSSQLCPDYTLQVFDQTCTPLVNDMTTHEQAAILLTNLWTTSNTAEKLLWQPRQMRTNQKSRCFVNRRKRKQRSGRLKPKKRRKTYTKKNGKRTIVSSYPSPITWSLL